MKTIGIYFNEQARKQFEQDYLNTEVIRDEIQVINYNDGSYGMQVPDEADDEECQQDIATMLQGYGYMEGRDYEF